MKHTIISHFIRLYLVLLPPYLKLFTVLLNLGGWIGEADECQKVTPSRKDLKKRIKSTGDYFIG